MEKLIFFFVFVFNVKIFYNVNVTLKYNKKYTNLIHVTTKGKIILLM